MNKVKIKLSRTPILIIALLVTGCSDNTDEELKEKERRALEQYLIENNITVEPTASGLYFIPVEEGDGIKPEETDFVEIEYTGELVDGTVFGTTYDSVAAAEYMYDQDAVYGPLRFLLNQLLPGLKEGLTKMNEGGAATLIVPSDIGLGSSSSYLIPAYSTMIYNIKLTTVIEDPDAHETRLIQAFLDSNNIDKQASTDTVYYIEEVAGEGDSVSAGHVVSVFYRAYYLDGREFDSNIGEEAYMFSYPGKYLIEGWNEGLSIMQKGSKGTLLIPYKKGYGEAGLVDQRGITKVGPYMTILFDMEITDLQ